MCLYCWAHLLFSMKKNTLLYLDNFLVERAKQEKINISELTEEALKNALERSTPKTASEYLRRAIVNTKTDVTPYGEAYLLPFQIQSVKLQKIGMISDYKLEFKKDAINIICGPNGSGKSTIIRAILQVFYSKKNYFGHCDEGKIQVELFSDQQCVQINANEYDLKDLTRGYRCLVLDDFFGRATPLMFKDLLELIKELNIQVIGTALDASKFPQTTNIINL